MNRPSQPLRFDNPAPARFSAGEFLRMAGLGAFDDMRVELDHGELVRMNPPYTAHAIVQAQVLKKLFRSLVSTDVEVVSEISVLLPDDTIRAFDAAIIVRAALEEEVLRPQHVVLGIEVSDTTLNLDLGDKLRDYADAGIPVYWVVDVQARAVHVLQDPGGRDYRRRKIVRFEESLDLPEGLGTIVLD
jgi:Uma2 family endonuclease